MQSVPLAAKQARVLWAANHAEAQGAVRYPPHCRVIRTAFLRTSALRLLDGPRGSVPARLIGGMLRYCTCVGSVGALLIER